MDSNHQAHTDDIIDIFLPGGRLQRLLDGYEHRSEQAEMAQAVQRVLKSGDIGLIEAGTGTGKSLAYLIPAAAYSISHQKPVVIATHTISLQEQLINEEIPRVQKIFPELKVTLVKGWRNYVCHQRLEAALEQPGDLLEPGFDDELKAIAEWAQTSEDGTRSDLPFEPSPIVWDQAAAESDSCLRNRCPHYDRCPFFRDRARMAGAHLLVVNHHLLFSDVAVRRQMGWESDQAVLPPYASVIFDEAHHVEDVATDHLGASISSLGVSQIFGRIHRRTRSASRGLVASLRRIFAEDAERLDALDREVIPAATQGEMAVQEVFARVQQYVRQEAAVGNLTVADSGTERVRIVDGSYWDQEVAPLCDQAVTAIRRLAGLLADFHEAIESSTDEAFVLAARGQAEAARRRLNTLAAAIGSFAALQTDAYVYWLEWEVRRPKRMRLAAAPIDVGPDFVEWIESQCESVLLVSATLSVQQTFTYVRERLGLGQGTEVIDRFRLRQTLIATPFEYREQALLGLVTDMPDPSSRDFAPELARGITHLVEASEGRALVLFTSYSLLRQVAQWVGPGLRRQGIDLLIQGESPRTQLLERMRSDHRTALFGTDSFWEGIDVPGKALSLVILTRLPFDVPTDPVTAARSERLEVLGRSPFAHYSLPRAVLKLKQGFGRLIRSKSDRGAVVVCDRRIQTKPYGRVFLESLPECATEAATAEELAVLIKDFL